MFHGLLLGLLIVLLVVSKGVTATCSHAQAAATPRFSRDFVSISPASPLRVHVALQIRSTTGPYAVKPPGTLEVFRSFHQGVGAIDLVILILGVGCLDTKHAVQVRERRASQLEAFVFVEGSQLISIYLENPTRHARQTRNRRRATRCWLLHSPESESPSDRSPRTLIEQEGQHPQGQPRACSSSSSVAS